jgi:leader peptidase (prepilin peptidase)/N-methyltransferase
LLFAAACLRFGMSWTLALRDWPMIAAFIAVAFIDLDHRIIPNRLNLFGALVGAATAMLDRELGVMSVFIGGVAGFGVFYGFAWLYHAMTGRSGLGGGDVKFLGVAGLFLGAEGVFWTILLSSVIGSVSGIGYALIQRIRTGSDQSLMKVAIPYGPFLVLGALYYYFFRGQTEWLRFTTPM